MAQQIDAFPKNPRTLRRGSKYDEFLDGSIYQFDIRETGHASTASLGMTLRQVCYRRGLQYRQQTLSEYEFVFQVLRDA